MSANMQVLVPITWSTTQRGDFFEDLVAKIFSRIRFKVYQRLQVTGMEIDLLAENLDTKERALVECKFMARSVESQIISKLVGNAAMREDISLAYLVSTSKPGKDAMELLSELERKGNFIRQEIRLAFIGPDKVSELFVDVHNLPNLDRRLQDLPVTFKDSLGGSTLVITPEESCWVLEQKGGGLPEKALVMSTDPYRNGCVDFTTLKRLIDENELWVGLTLENGLPTVMQSGTVPLPASRREFVTQVPMAERFDDYAPARPEDFVGRTQLLSSIGSFFEQVRQEKQTRRVVAVSGLSGFGKSSLVLKLADRCRHNTRWENKYYLYHVDSRSATSPLFVTEAIKNSFQEAVDKGFIKPSTTSISIDSVEDPFASKSVQACLQMLKQQSKLLIIFFDQFEELLTKEALQNTFEAFRKVAFAVEALQANFVVGFSWRTGISVPEAHPAYHTWHLLQDKRVEFKVGPFSSKESAEMLTTLERNLVSKIESPLRRHMLEQSQGFPWLLKKFCVHVYRQLSNGTNQRTLLESQLDATTLFEEDTNSLSNDQLACLKYVALNSPVDLIDVQEKFGWEVPEYLYQRRLTIKTGYRYSVYWDIFKEFLISGTVPPIPMTFFPQPQLSTALSVLKYVAEEGPVLSTDIQQSFDYTIKTVWNIVSALSAFFLIKRGEGDEVEIVDDLIGASDTKIADYIASQLERHIVVQEIRKMLLPGESVAQQVLENRIIEFYPSITPESLHQYMNGLLSWLTFAGLVELKAETQADVVVRPAGEGDRKGRVIIRRSIIRRQGAIVDEATFLCSAGPKAVIHLALQLSIYNNLPRVIVEQSGFRNAAHDLICLGLARWKNGVLQLTELIHADLEMEVDSALGCKRIIGEVALRSKFLSVLASEIATFPVRSNTAICHILERELGRKWQPASRLRYLRAGKRWLQFFGDIDALRGQNKLFTSDFNL